ncbi:hypothetical protein B7463_g8491, partial [Scytalidium lignicola]
MDSVNNWRGDESASWLVGVGAQFDEVKNIALGQEAAEGSGVPGFVDHSSDAVDHEYDSMTTKEAQLPKITSHAPQTANVISGPAVTAALEPATIVPPNQAPVSVTSCDTHSAGGDIRKRHKRPK